MSLVSINPDDICRREEIRSSFERSFYDTTHIKLFSGYVRQRADRAMWTVRMRLCGEDEHDMKKLFEHMKKDDAGGNDEVDLPFFGSVLHQMVKFDLAEKFYRCSLKELSPDNPLLSSLYHSLGLGIEKELNYLNGQTMKITYKWLTFTEI